MCLWIAQNFGGRNRKTPEPIDKKLAWVVMSAMTPRKPKLKTNAPLGDVAVYAWNITLAWFLVFLSYLFLWLPILLFIAQW